MVKNESSGAEILGRSVVAGVAGTVVMTVFQKLVEMPLTGRPDSYAPAELVEKVFRIHPEGPARWRLNNVTHLALGSMWGAAYGVVARAGLRGPRAVGVVFGAVYMGDVVLNTALGLYRPREWSRQDWTVDLIDKLVQAAATGVIFDRMLDPARPSSS